MKRAIALVAVPALAFALAACGDSGDKDASDPSPLSASATAQGMVEQKPHNEQDVMFAQMMIPHHRQAVEMAGLAPSRASSAQVKALAADIEKAQAPEIAKMTGWLEDWGAPAAMSGMHHDMPGIMSEKDMTSLKDLKGTAFDKAFLQMMIKHHQGAVTMARTEDRSGQNPDAKALATSIVRTQSAEIAKMRGLLK
ncbi:DUF305 domain-containing protein [Actinomadura violacea]|uniref:DUF305 domain-containing protein n=1 Tax=Actinomadura violacea TaxID=2819934 RepID=A0ABS3RH09_9ACTN|nr:DUF305 domain-containing protein [Actinomadura violacea]MBO2456013.1 DUF305 domain-containing protein [Actinomadura violacea]